MGNKVSYLLVCLLAILLISACIHSNTTTVPQIGDKVPNISWTTISGEKIDLNQFKGSWVLLCYWCSCIAHRQDILAIQSVYNAMYDKNLKVIVLDETPGVWISMKDFAEDNNLPFYIVEDNQKSINNIMPPEGEHRGRPIYFLIDTMGNLHDIRPDAFNGLVGESGPENVIGFLKAVIEVTIDDVSVTNVTACGATVSWKTDNVVSCWLEIKRQNEHTGVCTVDSTQGINHKMKLDFLKPNTTYIINVAADCLEYTFKTNNISSQYRYSRSKEFSLTTLSDNLTTPHISNVKVSKITDKSAEIYWETDREATGIINLRIIHEDEFPERETPMYKEEMNFTKKHTLIMDNLEPNHLCTIDLESGDSIGSMGTYHLGFVTQPLNYKTYGVEIFNISIFDITDKGAEITWSTDRIVSSWGCFTTFCSGGDKPSHDHSQTLSKLKPDTEYYIQLMVKDGGGVSDVYSFRTLKATKSK